MFSRECPKCSKLLSYSRKSNLDKAIKKNALCRSCANSDVSEKTKKKMSESRKEVIRKMSPEDRKKSIDKMASSLRTNWSNKSEEEKEEWRQIVSKTSKDRWVNPDYREKTISSMKDYWDNLEPSEREKRIDKSINNGAGCCSYYDSKGYRVQGMTELRFIDFFMSQKDIENPIKSRPKAIRTPYGLYYPDFITIKGMVYEVKSSYTFKWLKNKKGEKQLKKMIWINENLKDKKVTIFLEKEKGTFVKFEDLNEI